MAALDLVNIHKSFGATQILDKARSKLTCQNIELVRADAGDYLPPNDTSVVYFFNPFGGDTLLKVITNLKDSLRASPRVVKILYYNPHLFEKLIVGCTWLEKRGEIVVPTICPYRVAVYQAGGGD